MLDTKFTREQLEHAVRSSYSLRETLRNLQQNEHDKEYRNSLKRCILFYNINTDHFCRRKDRKSGIVSRKRLTDEEVFCKNTSAKSNSRTFIKKRMIKRGIPNKCFKCGISDWMDEAITLQLHHIDGDNNNNEIDNLQLLCPNCHAQTNNHSGRNKNRLAA